MRLAFYAPLKDPNHPVPSGDRTMAKGLVAALERGGHQVEMTSDLRIYDKMGEPDRQDNLFSQANDEAARLLQSDAARHWQAWVTYHNYYKAPDLIGPNVARILGIPYFLIEATRARKRLNGPWARFASAAEAACDQAHTIFYLTDRDAEALRRDAPDGQSLVHLRPFLARATLPAPSSQTGPMLAVGMMRQGDKLASYALIAETLSHLQSNWALQIAGDGPARPDVEALLERFGSRVRFLGALEADALAQVYAEARLLLWPGVNEAFGLSYLEAQAAGVPVVAQDRPGVCDVVHSERPSVAEGPKGLAHRITSLLNDPVICASEGNAARDAVTQHHLLSAAATTLTGAIEAAI